MGNQRLDHLLSKETAVLRGPEPASQDCKVKSIGLRADRQCMSVCCFLERPLLEVVYRAEALRAKAGSIFDNRQLEVERELQLIYEIGGERSPP